MHAGVSAAENIGRRSEKQSNLINMEAIEKAVAKSLMEIKAVMLRPESPFTWASGWKSPMYCDNRRILSYPEIRENVCRWMAEIITKQYPEVEVIAGVQLERSLMDILWLIFLESRSAM